MFIGCLYVSYPGERAVSKAKSLPGPHPSSGRLHSAFVIAVVRSLGHVQLFETSLTAACQASLSFTISQSCSNSCPVSWWLYPTMSSSFYFGEPENAQTHTNMMMCWWKSKMIQALWKTFWLSYKIKHTLTIWPFPGGSVGKESSRNVRDLCSIPGLVDNQEKEMAAHSSVLAWRIPWIEKPRGLQSMGSQRVEHHLET